MARVALFDLDLTVLDVNSGHRWLAHEVRAGRMTWLAAAWAVGWMLRYAAGWESGLEQAYRRGAAGLAGELEATMDARVRAWFHEELAERVRPGALEAIARHREAGDRLVLATSTSIYLARVAAEHFGFDDCVATTFEVEDGRLTGRLRSIPIGSGKTRCVEAWAESEGVRLKDCIFYTDSSTDLELLTRVGEPRVVHPDRRLNREARARGWPVLEW